MVWPTLGSRKANEQNRVQRMSVTDRQTTDGRATAYSEREREFTSANKVL